MQKYYDTIIDPKGNAQEGVPVAVYQTGTSTLAPLYEDDETTPKTNPLTSNDVGFFSAKIPNGKYDIVVGDNDPIVGVDILDFDPSNAAITGGTIDGVTIGGTTPPDATFNDVTVNGNFNN